MSRNHEIAVTGASGFLGRHFVSDCLSRGEFDLRLLTRHPEDMASRFGARVVRCAGDLLRPDTLAGFMRPGSTVIHLAYLPEGRAANMAATENLIAAAKRAGVRRVVHCSTAVVVGFRTVGVITEDTVPQPEGGYQETKLAVENTLRRELSPGIELAILRPTEVIGPGGRVPPVLRRITSGGRFSNAVYAFILRSRRFNYISVSNVVEALILLATTPVEQKGDVYFISDDDDPDNCWSRVEDIARRELGRGPVRWPAIALPGAVLPFLFKFLPGHSRPDRVYSHARISALGYRSVSTLRETIAGLVRAMES